MGLGKDGGVMYICTIVVELCQLRLFRKGVVEIDKRGDLLFAVRWTLWWRGVRGEVVNEDEEFRDD